MPSPPKPPRPRLGVLALLALGLLGAARPDEAAPTERPGREPARIALEGEAAAAERLRLLAMVHEKRAEEIALLRSLLANATGERRSGLLLRLGTLYEDEGDVALGKSMEALQACELACDCACELDRIVADSWYDKALRAYERVTRYDPRFEDVDVALLYRGALQAELGQSDEAVTTLEQLVTQYPNSDVATTAWLRLGRLMFDVNQIKPATLAFERAKAEAGAPLQIYAVYMYAWSLYNLGDYNDALDAMREVVERSFEVPKGGQVEDLDALNRRTLLQEESLKDLALFYTESNDFNEGEEFLQLIGQRDLIRPFREHLIRVFQARGWFTQEAAQYHKLLTESPEDPEALDWQLGRVRAQLDRDALDRFVEELAILRASYRPDTAWWKANITAPGDATLVEEKIEGALRAGATRLNVRGRELRRLEKRDAPRVLDISCKIYDLYFATYGAHELAYDARFDHADLLWDLNRLEEAYLAWEAALAQRPHGPRTAEAARNMMLGARKLHAAARVPAVPAGKDPVPLHPAEQRLLDAYLRYAEHATDDDERRDATFRAAVLLYEHRDYTAAQPILRRVTRLWPKSEQAEEAAHRALFALEQEGRLDEVRALAKELRTSQVGASSSFINEVADIEAAATFKRIEDALAATGDKVAAADALVQLYRDYPGFAKADLALHNAAVYYRSLERWAEASATSRLLVEDAGYGPTTPYYMTQLGALAYDMERTAVFDQAIDLYGRLVDAWPQARQHLAKATPPDQAAIDQLDETVADALWRRATLSRGLGQHPAAIAAYDLFATSFPADRRAIEARLLAARTLAEDGDHREAAARYAAFYKAHPADEGPGLHFYARLEEAKALRTVGEGHKALKLYEAAIKAWERDRDPAVPPPFEVATSISEMKFALLEPKVEAFVKIRFNSVVDGDGLKGAALQQAIRREDQASVTALKAKLAGLVEIKAGYDQIIALAAGDWVLRSAVAQGRVHEEMQRSFEEAECSFYLTEDQCDIYRMRMQDRAYPHGQEALTLYQQAIELARAAGAWSEAVKEAARAHDRLADEPIMPTELLPSPVAASRARVYELEPTFDPPRRAQPEPEEVPPAPEGPAPEAPAPAPEEPATAPDPAPAEEAPTPEPGAAAPVTPAP